MINMNAANGNNLDFVFFTIFYKSPPADIQTLWFIEGLLTDIVLIFIIAILIIAGLLIKTEVRYYPRLRVEQQSGSTGSAITYDCFGFKMLPPIPAGGMDSYRCLGFRYNKKCYEVKYGPMKTPPFPNILEEIEVGCR